MTSDLKFDVIVQFCAFPGHSLIVIITITFVIVINCVFIVTQDAQLCFF